MQDDEVARLPHGPLDILGLAEMFLQLQGDVGQGPDLVVGEAGGLGLRRLQGDLLHAPGRAAGEGHGFFGHPAPGDGVGVLAAHHKEVRGHGAVHGVLAQAPDRRNHHGVVLGGVGVQGKHDAAGPGRDHGQDAHGHGEGVDGKLLVFPVENGPGGKLAGHDLLVVPRQRGGVDVQEGGKLAGKGEFGVLAHGAGAHRQPPGGQVPARLDDGFFQVRGQGGLAHHGLEFPADGLEAVQVFDVGLGELFTQVGGQAGGFEKALVGRGGNGEALGHRQADAVADLAQVGHLAAHRRGQVPVQGRQGQDKRGIRDGGDRFQLRQHLGLEALADGDQVGFDSDCG